MKTYFRHIAIALSALICLASCKEMDIPAYRVEDSAVFFNTSAMSYSLKGFVGEELELSVPVSMFGPKTDSDRLISVSVKDSVANTAVLGTDFTIVGASVPANELSGSISLKVKNLPDTVEELSTTLEISTNDSFTHLVKDSYLCRINWSKQYVRPSENLVWRSWFLFFSQGYSRKYHEVLMTVFGPEIEISSNQTGARKREDLIYHQPSWWYNACRVLNEYVRDYDAAHPGEPLMHSDDYEYYLTSSQAVGEGQKPERIPTIAETLISM